MCIGFISFNRKEQAGVKNIYSSLKAMFMRNVKSFVVEGKKILVFFTKYMWGTHNGQKVL